MAREDVYLAWWHGPVPDEIAHSFTRPTRVINMPNPPGNIFSGVGWRAYLTQELGMRPVQGLMNKYKVDAARVGLLGFSASCMGVSFFLGSADGQLIDTAVAIDGIHAKPPVAWVPFASAAAHGQTGARSGGRCCVITHTQIARPSAGTYATHESAAEILGQVFRGTVPDPSAGAVPPELWKQPHVPPIEIQGHAFEEMPNRYAIVQNGLYVLGFEGTHTWDHIYQAKVVLPAVLRSIVVPRWNREDPDAGVCVVT